MSHSLAITFSGPHDPSNNILMLSTSLPDVLVKKIIEYFPVDELTTAKVHGFVTRLMLDNAIKDALQKNWPEGFTRLHEHASQFTLVPYQTPDLTPRTETPNMFLRWATGGTTIQQASLERPTYQLLKNENRAKAAYIAFGPEGEINLTFISKSYFFIPYPGEEPLECRNGIARLFVTNNKDVYCMIGYGAFIIPPFKIQVDCTQLFDPPRDGSQNDLIFCVATLVAALALTEKPPIDIVEDGAKLCPNPNLSDKKIQQDKSSCCGFWSFLEAIWKLLHALLQIIF